MSVLHDVVITNEGEVGAKTRSVAHARKRKKK
jgi:hypothetical protein